MTRFSARATSLFVGAALLGIVAATPAAACHDRTDDVVVKLRKADLTTDQLKSIFEFQQEHRDLITKAHAEGLGCSFHESKQADFEKAAFGVLKDEQFRKLKGRERTEEEALRYENHLLKQEIARLEMEIRKLKGLAPAAAPSKN